MKECAFFDVDYTLYDGYLCTNFNLFMANRKYATNPSLVYETEVKIQDVAKTDYKEATRMAVQHTADLLKGKTVGEVERLQEVFLQEENKFFPWVIGLLSFLKEKDYDIYLISGAATPLVYGLANFLTADKIFGSNLVIRNDIYTGEVEYVLNYEEKSKLIRKIINQFGSSRKLGFGDSMGDADMLSNMDIAFLYEPKSDQIKQLAVEKGWYITDRNNILEIVQGCL